MKYILSIILLILASCSSSNLSKYRVTPNSLISSSEEKVNFNLNGKEAMEAILEWISEDIPSFVTLSCKNNKICQDFQNILNQENIPFELSESLSAENFVELSYDRLNISNCKTSTLGCSNSANILRQISSQKQLINPAINNYKDAQKANNNYKLYLQN